MAAKHPHSRFFLDSGIYDGLSCFAELEERIACLAISKDKGDAFEVFAEAYLATRNITQGKHVWPFAALPLSIAQDLQLDTGRDMGVDGVMLVSSGTSSDTSKPVNHMKSIRTFNASSIFGSLRLCHACRIIALNILDGSIGNHAGDRIVAFING